MKIPNVLAKFSKTPGEIQSLGPKHSEHTTEILKDVLNLTDEKISQLKEAQII